MNPFVQFYLSHRSHQLYLLHQLFLFDQFFPLHPLSQWFLCRQSNHILSVQYIQLVQFRQFVQ